MEADRKTEKELRDELAGVTRQRDEMKRQLVIALEENLEMRATLKNLKTNNELSQHPH